MKHLISIAIPIGILILFTTFPTAARQPNDPLTPLIALSGTWTYEDDGAVWEEMWSEPTAGSMVGTSKFIKGAKTALYEFMVIEADDEANVVMLIHHFNLGMKLWESERDGPMRFELTKTEIGATPSGTPQTRELVFERQTDTAQQRIVYSFIGNDDLKVSVENLKDDAWLPEVTIDFHRLP